MSDWITVRVADAQGSVPRETGAEMRVWTDRTSGTIGGGRLEWDAIAEARALLHQGQDAAQRRYALGPELGQCCGGAVTLDYIRNAPASGPQGAPIWIWGAGHVGQALAQVLAPFDTWPITLIDDQAARLPADLPDTVAPLLAADPLLAVPQAAPDAQHLIVTYSHDLDLKLCDALLRHGFGACGLIGSATKWARFRSRLAALGHSDAQISRIACPIGDPSLGKHPQAIAVGVAQALVSGSGLSRVRGEGET